MLFSSITFLYYFLPLTLAVYLGVPKKGKNAVLLLASFLFYFWGEPKYCLLMAISVAIGYIGGRCIEKYKAFVWVFTAGILFLLLLFKYADFIIGGINHVPGMELPLLQLVLPIGISFYTFQIISYLVDVSRAEVKAEVNLIDFATYVMMFPQLIAGPIVRFSGIKEQMKSRHVDLAGIGAGSGRFVCGLAKKVLIADVLGELVQKLEEMGQTGVLTGWVLAAAFMLQLYYDFSGYSDMAIGLGRMLGFHFPENFDYPYISKSITEFWRRWHMTLGGWFRDYVYIPLGGNRVPVGRWMLNICIVWFLSGLWHGASINFILWGLYFGMFLFLEKVWLGERLKKLPDWARHLYTLFVTAVSFVIFRLENLNELGTTLLGMFGMGSDPKSSARSLYEIKSYGWILLFAAVGATPAVSGLLKWIKNSPKFTKAYPVLKVAAVPVLLLLVTAFLISSSVHPFLYFRF